MDKVIALLQQCFCVEPTSGKSNPDEVLAVLGSGGYHFSWAILPPEVVLTLAPTRMTHVGVCLREVSRSGEVNGLLIQKLDQLRAFLRERNLEFEVDGPHERETRVSEVAVRASRFIVWVDLSSPGAGPLVAELLTEEHGHGV